MIWSLIAPTAVGYLTSAMLARYKVLQHTAGKKRTHCSGLVVPFHISHTHESFSDKV